MATALYTPNPLARRWCSSSPANIACSRLVNGPDSTTSVDSAPVCATATSGRSESARTRKTTPRARERHVEDEVRAASTDPLARSGQHERCDDGARKHGGEDDTDLGAAEPVAIERRPEQHGAEPVGIGTGGLGPKHQPDVGHRCILVVCTPPPDRCGRRLGAAPRSGCRPIAPPMGAGAVDWRRCSRWCRRTRRRGPRR